MKSCKYCKRVILGKPVKGFCSELHFKLWKQNYNAGYYKKNARIILSEKYAGMLRTLMKQFGEGVSFEAEILEHMGFDWEFSKQKVQLGSLEYTVIGEYTYIVFSNQKANIRRI